MVAEVVPVWQHHVEATRQAMELGIGDLLAAFSRLCKGVEGVEGTQQRSQPPLGAHLARTDVAPDQGPDRILSRLIDQADVTHQRREQLLAQLAESLVQMEAIESALCGTLPDETPLRQRLDERRTALSDLARQVAADTRQDHTRQDQALAEARQSLCALAEAPTPSSRTEQDLERVLLGLQFPDRLSQTLSHLARDMQRFTEWMRDHEHASPEDAARWRTELERAHALQDQTAPPQRGTVEYF
jgi:hypothetical protein